MSWSIAPLGPEPGLIQPFISWPDALGEDEIDRIVAFGDMLPRDKAILTGVDKEVEYHSVRESQTAWIQPGTADGDWLHDRMTSIIRRLNAKWYRFDITGFYENMQYTIYEGHAGGHYDWHIDLGDQALTRKLSLVIQLTDPKDYVGGDLEVMIGGPPQSTPKAKGMLVAFPSFVLHRVSPITAGTRKSLVVWAGGPSFT